MCVAAGVNHAIIRANVVSGIRPSLSKDDDCLEEYRDLIVRCWDAQPDVRLHFKGRPQPLQPTPLFSIRQYIVRYC